jgi:hypothetical protein
LQELSPPQLQRRSTKRQEIFAQRKGKRKDNDDNGYRDYVSRYLSAETLDESEVSEAGEGTYT